MQMHRADLQADGEPDPQLTTDSGAQQQQVANGCHHQLQQQQQAQEYEQPNTQWTPFGTVSRGSRGSTDLVAAKHVQQLSEGQQGGSSSRGSRDVDYRASQHSTVGEAAAGGFSNSTSGSCEHRQQDGGQQQQQLWGAGAQQQQHQQDEVQAEDEFEDMVSSGEELDGLGELGSSDNEGERFLQVSSAVLGG